MKIQVIYKDDDLLVINKPAGLVVYSEDDDEETVMTNLLRDFSKLEQVGEKPRFGMVHRLDRETSGILLISRNEKAFSFFQEQFKKRNVEKKYLALSYGKIKRDSGIIKTLIGHHPKDGTKRRAYPLVSLNKGSKKRAVSLYKVLKRYKKGNQDYTLLEVEIKTGRRHQIRVHLRSLGYPIVGDKDYKFRKQLLEIDRQFLHAAFLKIKLLNNKIKEFRSDLPEYLENYLKQLNEISGEN